MAMSLRIPSFALWSLAVVAHSANVGHGGFLASKLSTRMSRSQVEQQLLEEMNAALGHGANHARLDRLQESMQSVFRSLPKDRTGHIDHGVARYALHRYFLSRHGWHIRGLAPDGERWSAGSSTSMLKSRVPDFILDLFDKRPIDLETLAVVAATVEDLVHADTVELLRMAYTVQGLSADEPLVDPEQESMVIKTYLLYFIFPWTQNELTNRTAIAEFLQDARDAYPGWENTLLWIEDLKGISRFQHRTESNPFSKQGLDFRSFSSMAQLMEQVIDGMGLFQNIECDMIKNKLLDLQDGDRNDGRVPLGKFYQDFLGEREYWFTESPEYLKNLGALDDSDPKRLSVIVPNIVYGRSNCLATSSGFHSLCCVNKCDEIMESVERGIAHPVASPRALAELVSLLSSDTVVAPRNLSNSLLQKLDRIAVQHAGHVPLHGRLFAQWLHHAFPNECPFPQVSGVTGPLTHDEWADIWKTDSVASTEVMQRFAAEANASVSEPVVSIFDEAALLWFDEEELVTALDISLWAMPGGEWRSHLLSIMAMCIAVGTTFAILLDSIRSCTLLARPGVFKTWL